MRARPVTPQLLVDLLADRVAGLTPGRRVRLAVDGAPVARPEVLADALVDPLRVRGRPVVRVRAGDFLRAASLRLERGREDPDALYEDWLDVDALTREVLAPLGPEGSGRYLPSLRDPGADRATRAPYAQAGPDAVTVLDGALLLGRFLPFELTVHLDVGAAALARRTDPGLRWTLPAYERYRTEVDPVRAADVAVRLDDPRRPAVVS